MELTREEAIRNFREHWASLAITGMSDKADYLRRNGYPEIAFNCFLCEFTNSTCSKCPIDWPQIRLAKNYSGLCLKSYYSKWDEADTPEERKRIAAIIRDLPEKKEEPKPDFKVGDWVEVINNYCAFTSYFSFFKENKLEQFANQYAASAPQDGEKYKIIAIGKHSECPDLYGPLYVLGKGDKVYIVNGHTTPMEPALKLAEPPKPEPKFKEGDKVVPISKTVPGWEGSAPNWDIRDGKEQGFLYVRRIDSKLTRKHRSTVYVCGALKTSLIGDFYFESDLIPYIETLSPKFKPGDKVKIKSVEEMETIRDAGPVCGGLSSEMFSYAGKVLEIKDGPETHDNLIGYYAKTNEFIWDERFLEPFLINFCPENKTVKDGPTTFIFNGPVTTCIIEFADTKFKGTAKCNPSDKWDEKTGKILAMARALRPLLDAIEKGLRQC